MSAGAYLDAQIRRINNDLNSIRNQIWSNQRYTHTRIQKLDRRLKLIESNTHPKRKQLPRITK